MVSTLNPTQEEQLKEIGAHLRQRRQSMSIPIEEVAAKTLIRLTLLKALEEGQSDQLPEPVFIQGFIRRYGDAIGIDGNALAKTFPINLLPVESDTSIPDLPPPGDRTQPVFLPLVLLLVAAAGGLLYLLNRPQSEPVVQVQNTPAAPPQKTVPQPIASSPATPTPVAVATPKAQKLNSPIEAAVNVQERSWMRVIVDGKTEFEGELEQGKQQTWTAKKQLTIRAGNPGGVLLSVNKGEPKLLGTRGVPKDVTFTPEGAGSGEQGAGGRE